jgi:hypothetical protein
MTRGPSTDVGLGHLSHLYGRLHPGGLTELLKGVLQGQGVDDRGQHAHVIGLGAIHARAIDREATVAFRDFLLSPSGRLILARYGFEFPAVP